MKFILGLAILCAVTVSLAVEQEANPFPRYKPFSRAPAPLDIRTNTYGASRTAPNALGVGDTVPDFTVPRAGWRDGFTGRCAIFRSGCRDLLSRPLVTCM